MKDTLVRTNKVAPVVIKSCKEEFQHHTDFKEPIVYGKIAEDMTEHALIMVSQNMHLGRFHKGTWNKCF